MSVNWHLPLFWVQKFILTLPSFCILIAPKMYWFLHLVYIFSNIPPPPLCITETFHESWLWGSAKWFYSKYRFWLGEMYLSNIHRHLNPSRYFLEIFKKWTSLFNMGFKYLDLDNQLFKYRWILSKKYVYYIPRRGIWMGYRSWHFSASEILSMIFFKKINNDARVWSSRKNTFSITAFNILYTHFF